MRELDHEILVMNLLLLLFVGLLPFTTALMAAYLKEGAGDHLAAGVYAGSQAVARLAARGQRRDDGLVDAVAVPALGDGHV